MLPKSFKPDGAYELIRMGSDHDGGYLVDPKSIEQSNALIALGIGRNWSFEKDFLERKKVKIHAYDYSIGPGYWIKHFFKRILAVLIGRLSAPFDAMKLFLEFKIFFKSKYAELADFFRGITDPIIFIIYVYKNIKLLFYTLVTHSNFNQG